MLASRRSASRIADANVTRVMDRYAPREDRTQSGAAGGPGSGEDLLPSPLVGVERASGDLRRGLPVIVDDAAGGRALAMAAELLSDAGLAALRRLSDATPDLALTHRRAATLKIRLYTPEVVLVPVSARLSARTVRSLADPAMDLANPMRGPFDAKRGRASESSIAAVRLAKIAGLLPAALLAPPPERAAGGFADAARSRLTEVAAADVLGYDVTQARRIERVASARVPLAGAEDARIVAFRPRDGGTEHLAIVIGDPTPDGAVLTRLHSECFTGDLLASLKCDCGQQLRGAIERIAAEGAGVLLYLAQEGRGIGLINKLRAYALQDQGFDTVEANQRLGFEADERLFLPAAEMLRALGFARVRLMTNNPDKVAALERFGVEVAERVPHAFPSNEHNAFYLSTKAEKTGHLF